MLAPSLSSRNPSQPSARTRYLARCGVLALTAYLSSPLTSFAETESTDSSPFSSEMEKVSYAIGLVHGQRMQQDVSNLSESHFHDGFKTGYSDSESLLDAAEIQKTLSEFQQKRQAELAEKQKAAGAENLQAGTKFLDENKTKKGVKVTESGLQYKIITTGKGPKPTPTSKVKVHYHGTLIDGTVFDSSIDRGQPATFPVNGVIAGWTEALQMMNAGSEWMLYIPSALAYGERAASEKIGPNSTLIFKVQLLEILPTS